jgi:hypothetical protein
VKLQSIEHQFVEFISEKLAPGHLYVSLEYNTASHLCACGCGFEVSTAFSPTDWNITYNGRSVTLSPSIGNSNFPCRSHYWIRGNRVVWESKMTPQLTALSRARDKAAKAREYGSPLPAASRDLPRSTPSAFEHAKQPWWKRLLPF